MLGFVAITPWHWAGFVLCVLFFLALDLGLFNRHARAVKFREAAAWSALWFVLAMAFAGLMFGWRGREEAIQFATGYIIELSLSMDNVFVIALIFAFFRVPSQYQHRVLFWGILGALLMRGVMIVAGAALVQRFQWTLYLFGAFLLVTGVKMLLVKDVGVHPEKNILVRFARKYFPVTDELHGQKFIVRLDGRRLLTPLALVLLVVETSDLIFALDSIPAIFAVTTKPFIVFTSNVFAILGLRSLYFLLAGAIDYFRYLKVGLSIVLVFIGVKMLLDPHGREPRQFQIEIPTGVSLMTVATIILIAIVLSVMVAEREKRTGVKASGSKKD
jgi:tellurite resistance protein TerC